MKIGPLNLITDVAGLHVGNAEDSRLRPGVTAVLFEQAAVAAVDVRGGGPGTRETEPACAREYGPAVVSQAAPPLGSTQQPVYWRACAGRTSHRKSSESKPAMRKSKAASAYDYQARPDGL
jgi:Peptidase family S58